MRTQTESSSQFAKPQRGSMLLEALIGILIFSLGILALMGLQAVSIKSMADASYRTEAAMVADKAIAQMWVAGTANLGGFLSPSGAAYTSWVNEASASSTVLPGFAANPPTIAVAGQAVTVTVFWQTPQDPTIHRHVVQAWIDN